MKIMDAPSLAPYTAQGEGWDEGLKILSLTLLKKSGEFIRSLAKVSFYLIIELAKTLLNVALGCLNFD